MNIIEALVKLRDDIKTWVTANLNAINAKIDEKTIPIDSELSSTSTNPVQNKVISAEIDSLNNLVGDTPVATQISTAIASQEHFSGDYNDLTNAPNISEDDSDNVVIADPNGNIIFKVDEEGAHTTDVEIDGTSLADKIPVWDAKSDFSGNYNDLVDAPDIIEDGAGNMVIADESGNIIFQVDENGLKTTIVQANQVKINGQDMVEMIENHTIAIDDALSDSSTNPVQNKVIYDKLSELTDMTPVSEQIATAIANQDLFSGDYNDLTNAPDIKEDGEGNMIIADENGNIIFKVDADGINTTAIKIDNQDVLDIMDSKIADLVDSSPDTLNTLNELAAALGDDPNFAATVAEQIGGKVDKVDGMGLSTEDYTTADKTKLSKIEDGATKTVVESELSATSENPVQSKVIYNTLDDLTGMVRVSTQIETAISSIKHPVTSVNGQTGDIVVRYDELENAPNIYEDSSNELVIVDPDGNIIFRSSGDGFETTTLTAQTVVVGTANITGVDSELSEESTNPVQNKVLAAALKNLDVEYPVTSVNEKTGDVVLTAEDVGALPDTTVIPSIDGLVTQDYVDSKLDELTGMETVSAQIGRAIADLDYPVDSVNGKTGDVIVKYEDLDGAPNIYEDGSNDLVIADNDGNIIFRSNGAGFETTTVTAQAVVVNGTDVETILGEKANKIYVEEELAKMIAEAKEDSSNKDAVVLFEVQKDIGTKVDKEEGKGLSSNDFTTAEKEKLAALTVDDVLSADSTNPVQSQAIYAKLDELTGMETVSAQINSAISSIILPAATSTTLGGVKVGDGLKISTKTVISGTDGTLIESDGGVLSVNVIDSLTSTSTTDPLSAAQGKVLKAALDSITTDLGDLGGGDMMKATYDTDQDGIIDIASGGTGNNAGYIRTGQKSDSEIGSCATAEGNDNIASGAYAHAEGLMNSVSGAAAHAEGVITTASGAAAHAEGTVTGATGRASHAEGFNTTASGDYSHAEGWGTNASGMSSHAEGLILQDALLISDISNAPTYGIGGGEAFAADLVGYYVNIAINMSEEDAIVVESVDVDNETITLSAALSSVEVGDTIYLYPSLVGSNASGESAHAEGANTTASGYYSHAEGLRTTASGEASHAGGRDTTAEGDYSHAEGLKTYAVGFVSHVEGYATQAEGNYSHAEGLKTYTVGFASHVEGYATQAEGNYSHAEGYETTASGKASHAEGNATEASGIYSHAEGDSTVASYDCSHAEGDSTGASGYASHAEGEATDASGYASHAEGESTNSSGDYSHAEGSGTRASGMSSHSEGYATKASSDYQHVQGKYNVEDTAGTYAHIVGNGTDSENRSNAHTVDWSGNAWFAGDVYVGGASQSDATKLATVDELIQTAHASSDDGITYAVTVSGITSLTAGQFFIMIPNKTSTNTTVTLNVNGLGAKNIRRRLSSGSTVVAGYSASWLTANKPFRVMYDGTQWIVEGHNQPVSADLYGTIGVAKGGTGKTSVTAGSYLVGNGTSALTEKTPAEVLADIGAMSAADPVGTGSFSMNRLADSTVGSYSVAVGLNTTASGNYSYAEGQSSVSSGQASHAEGMATTASGAMSHAEGHATTASGNHSHSSGLGTIASKEGQFVIGRYNVEDTGAGTATTHSPSTGAFVIGNGSNMDSESRSNAFRVAYSGNVYGGTYNSTGADYAEYFEWEDGNPNNEDRIGYFVTLADGESIKIASSDDEILGVVSGNGSVIGDAYDDVWQGMWMRDVYGRLLYEDVEVETIDEKGNTVVVTEHRMKLNPDYDNTKEYIPRSQRPEWGVVGMLGKLIVIDDGTCQVNGYCMVADDGTATASDAGYRVVKRVTDNAVKIIFK